MSADPKDLHGFASRELYLEAALRQVTKKLGRFRRDPLEHASNTIDDMASTAERAIVREWEPES